MEVFSFERPSVKVAADRISEKVAKYGQAVTANSLHLIVAMHGSFDSFFDDIDCESATSDVRLFDHHELSGVIFFAETNIGVKRMPDGKMKRKQFYGFTYFPNPTAARPINLSHLCV